MKILIDLRKMSKNPSGIGIYTFSFILALLKYSSYTIIGVTDVKESYEIKRIEKLGVCIYQYGKEVNKSIEVIKYFKFIKRIIIEVNPDYFWETNNILPINLQKNNTKIITTIHDIFPISTPQYYSCLYRMFFKYCIRKTLKFSDRIIYVSKVTKDECDKFFKINDNFKNMISYNIVDGNKMQYQDTNREKNYFLFIGNVEKRKGIGILLDAFKEYICSGGTRKLVLAGRVRDKELEAKIQALNLEFTNRIVLRGYISNKEKWTLLNECSAFVYPSLAEGFGIPPVEASYFNKKIIVSDIGIFKEVLGNEVEYFKIEDDYNKTVSNLRNKLLEVKNNEIVEYSFNEKYRSEKLISSIVNFLEN